ncbi:MAG TPA: WecB/TagA/CpsF family glycosyltransferase, partial [Candidatus Methylomirabilis sp.]|nr:WecB/TagA/CpsF family glycosyltransferase [Candidatus Methylomirabilis sp.]
MRKGSSEKSHHPGAGASNPAGPDALSDAASAPTRTIQLLNVRIDNLTMDELLARFDRGTLCTVHSDMLMWLQKDRALYEIATRCAYVTCDSQILAFATRLLGTPVKERISGSDFLPRFYAYHRNHRDISLFLLGGLGDVADRASQIINRKVGRNIVVGSLSPPIGAETSEAACRDMVNRVNASKASVLVLGLGTPKQERFLERYRALMPSVRIFLPLGGALDYEAGAMKRPPAWVSNIGLEWAYRFIQEPRKRWKRYLVDDVPVIHLILKQKAGL